MVVDENPFTDFEAGQDIPTVDPGDLRKMWEYFRELPSDTRAVGLERMKQVCTPGSDVRAVWYRIAMLWLLDKATGSLGRWLHYGKLDDAAVTIAATFPMKWMEPGKVFNELPFDAEKFLKEIENLSGK